MGSAGNAVGPRGLALLAVTAAAGLSDLTLRDLGVLGLALCLTGPTRQRMVLRR